MSDKWKRFQTKPDLIKHNIVENKSTDPVHPIYILQVESA